MAEYGFSCSNDSGLVQIDSNYRNMEILQSGTGQGSDSGFWSSISISFTSCPEPPMLFLRTTSAGYVSFNCWLRSGSNYVGAVIHCWANVQFSWFVASPQFSNSSETWGMHVFDEDGKKVFDSGRNYLKIVSVVVIPTTGSTSPYSHPTVPEPYYCAMGGNSYMFASGDESGGWDATSGLCIQSNGTSSVHLFYREITLAYPPGRYRLADYLPNGTDWIYNTSVVVGVIG